MRVDEDQLEMVYADEGAFSPASRLERAMDGSETAFRSEPLGTHPSNFHDLIGSVREPDPFLVVSEDGGLGTGKQYAADPGLLAELENLLSGIQNPEDQDEELCKKLQTLAAKDPKMPVLHERLAGCYQAVGKIGKALEALEQEIAINPSHSGAHLGLAAAAAAAGKADEARHHIIQALVYYPAFEEARKWVNATGAIPGTQARVEKFAPRLVVEVDEVGYVVIRSPENQRWVGNYATCKAGFRYAPEVRMAFGMKSVPYKPSLLEEMVCLRIAADAYSRDLEAGQPREVMGDIILEAARQRRLIEAALFEIIGMSDPDLMKFLPQDIGALVAFWIEDTVLLD